MKKSGIVKAIDRLDTILVVRFMLLAQKIDHRFGINPYRIAIYLLIASVFCGFFVFADGLKHSYLIYFIYAVLFPLFRLSEIRRLEKISTAYERFLMTPSNTFHLPAEWLYFMPGYMRLGNLVIYIILLPTDIYQALFQFKSTLHAIAYVVVDQWIILLSLAFFFAGGLPPGRGRKEKKKARDWTFMLQPRKVKT